MTSHCEFNKELRLFSYHKMKISFYLLTLILIGQKNIEIFIVLLIDPYPDISIKLRPTIFVITTWKLLNENSLKNLIKKELMIHYELLKLKETWHHHFVDLIKN